MSRPVLAAVAFAAVLSSALTAAVLAPPAHAEGTKVVCTQVAQSLVAKPAIDEQFVAQFMSEQLAAGHDHFTSITGISTVLCAY